MNICKSVILLAVLTVGACGGGGSSAPSNGGGNGGGGSGGATTNGTAKIVFPWTSSTATAPTITVRGLAADPEGVASVSVNGVAATITATGSAFVAGEVEWSAEVELAKGDNSLVVSVEDEAGNVIEEADAATVRWVEIPVTFSLDPERTRLVGLGYGSRVAQHNYDTLEQTVFGGPISTAPTRTCFRRFENEFLYLMFPGTWELRNFNLATLEDSLLAEITDADLDSGPEIPPSLTLAGLVCDSEHTSAYLLVNYFDPGSGGANPRSRVLEIDLTTGLITTLSETDTTVSPRWLAQYMALTETTLVAMEDVEPLAPLTSISLADGTRTFLTPGLAVGGLALDPDLDAGRVYVATFEGVDEIDVIQSNKRNVSVVDDDHPLVFSQVSSVAFDPANNRVIVGDSDLEALIAIDISSGERSELLSRKVGTGTGLVEPQQFAISADGTRAYVADYGGGRRGPGRPGSEIRTNAPERLFEIDLATGNRRVIGDISRPGNFDATGLALDEAGQRVFVSHAGSLGRDLLEVDLVTENVETIASIDSTDLKSIDSLILDSDNGRLLVGDVVSDAIFALDLTTHAIEVVSQPNVIGDGPAFGGPGSMTWGAATSELYVAGQESWIVTRVDLETGNREELAAICDPDPTILIPPFPELDQVLYNPALNELLISGFSLYRFDLDTAACNALSSWSPLQIQVTPTNQILAVVFGALVQIDPGTGEFVIVSK